MGGQAAQIASPEQLDIFQHPGGKGMRLQIIPDLPAATAVPSPAPNIRTVADDDLKNSLLFILGLCLSLLVLIENARIKAYENHANPSAIQKSTGNIA
jgi:hypothetical protein